MVKSSNKNKNKTSAEAQSKPKPPNINTGQAQTPTGPATDNPPGPSSVTKEQTGEQQEEIANTDSESGEGPSETRENKGKEREGEEERKNVYALTMEALAVKLHALEVQQAMKVAELTDKMLTFQDNLTATAKENQKMLQDIFDTYLARPAERRAPIKNRRTFTPSEYSEEENEEVDVTKPAIPPLVIIKDDESGGQDRDFESSDEEKPVTDSPRASTHGRQRVRHHVTLGSGDTDDMHYCRHRHRERRTPIDLQDQNVDSGLHWRLPTDLQGGAAPFRMMQRHSSRISSHSRRGLGGPTPPAIPSRRVASEALEEPMPLIRTAYADRIDMIIDMARKEAIRTAQVRVEDMPPSLQKLGIKAPKPEPYGGEAKFEVLENFIMGT